MSPRSCGLLAAFACDAGGEGSGEGEMREQTAFEGWISHAIKLAWSRVSAVSSVFAIILSMVATCCTSTHAESFGTLPNPMAYRTWVANTFINGPNYQSTYIYWLNDETVVFDGYPEQATSKNFRTLRRSLFTWKLGDVPQQYSTTGWAGYGYCASDGVIVYSLKPTDGSKFPTREMRGTPGQGVDVPILNLQFPPTTASVDDSICRRYVDPKMVGRSWVADISRSFYLDFGPSVRPHTAQVVLQRADGTQRKELPISFTDFPTNCVHSYQFTSTFFVWDCINSSQDSSRSWRDANCWPIWKVALPGGEVEKICISYGVWAGASIEIIPTKAGMFFTSRRQSTNDPYSPDEAGLYRLDNGSVKLVLPGLIEHIKISPSGCKVAFVYAPNFMATQFEPPVKQQDRSKVVAIDVCSKSSRAT
jgi:hypothetical protein